MATNPFTRHPEFRESLLDAIRRQLSGDYCVTLTKYSYLNGGAPLFVEFEHSESYTSYRREVKLLDNILPALREHLSGKVIEIIDLGVGDGNKAVHIAGGLDSKIMYHGIDISEEMLSTAKKNQSNFPSAHYSICDFSDGNYLESILGMPQALRLFMSLGSTIANEPSMLAYLKRIRGLARGGYYLVGMELRNCDNRSILSEYDTPENRELTVIPVKLAGIDPKEGKVNIIYNPQLNRIEERFIFKNNGSLPKTTISYNAGQELLLSVTNKPTFAEYNDFLQKSGWNEVYTSSAENYAVSLLK